MAGVRLYGSGGYRDDPPDPYGGYPSGAYRPSAPTTPSTGPGWYNNRYYGTGTVPDAGSSPLVDYFSQWYNRSPEWPEYQDFLRQSQSWKGAHEQVYQNLYQNSPSYNPSYPTYQSYQAWRQTQQTQPPPANAGTTYPPTQEGIMAYLGALDPTKGLGPYADELARRFGVTILGDDKIVLPDGSVIDVIGNYGLPSASWVWYPYTGGSNSGYPGVPGVPININDILSSGIWNDPSLALLEQLGRQRLDELFKPVDDPYRNNFFKMLEDRIAQLQAPPFTETEEGTMVTVATDRLQRDRQAAHAEVDQRLAAMGHAKGSGTLAQAHLEVDRQFDQLVNAQKQGFDIYAIQELNRRRDQAVGLGGAASQLSQSVRNEEEARRREALTIASMFPELQNQQLMRALAVLTGSPYTGPSIFSQMMGLAQLGNQQNQFSQSQDAAFWQALGSLIYNTYQQSS